MDDSIWVLIAVAAAVVLVALVAFAVSRARRRRRTARLRRRFGPEYDTAVHRYGRSEGEQHLEDVLREHDARRLRDVPAEDRDAALASFDALQASFVESPVTAVREADHLVFAVLRERGYPLETVDDRASALSVEEPELASRYRSAIATLVRAEASGDADIGRLRDALLTYRELLQELVGAPHLQGRLTTQTDAPQTDDRPDLAAPGVDTARDARTSTEEERTWTSTRTESTS